MKPIIYLDDPNVGEERPPLSAPTVTSTGAA